MKRGFTKFELCYALMVIPTEKLLMVSVTAGLNKIYCVKYAGIKKQVGSKQ